LPGVHGGVAPGEGDREEAEQLAHPDVRAARSASGICGASHAGINSKELPWCAQPADAHQLPFYGRKRCFRGILRPSGRPYVDDSGRSIIRRPHRRLAAIEGRWVLAAGERYFQQTLANGLTVL